MKKSIILLTLLTGIVAFTVSGKTMSERNTGGATQRTIVNTDQTYTVTVTITKINLELHKIWFRDQNDKEYEFVVDPQSGIDLTKYKVGDVVKATIKPGETSRPGLRARISKTQLIKLQ